MSIYSKLHPITGEFLGGHEPQKGTVPQYPFYVPVPMHLEPKDGFAIVFNPNTINFEYVEDHRQKFNEVGSLIGGTPFWMDGDTYETPARYMMEPGPIPAGALLEAPKQIFTVEELARQVRDERDRRLSTTQWIMDRHTEQIAAGATTSLSETEYMDWLIYRQDLRDLPAQAGFPWNGPNDTACPWPVIPTNQ